MANRKNIEKVIRLIEAAPVSDGFDVYGFNMMDYCHDCGTPQCIAGFTDAARLGLGYDDDVDSAAWEQAKDDHLSIDVFDRRAEYLGITRDEVWKLCHPDQNILPWPDITKEQALSVLRWLMVTGEVDWTVALPEQWELLPAKEENELV